MGHCGRSEKLHGREQREKKQLKNKIVAFVMTSEFTPPFRSGAEWPHWSTCYYSSNADGENSQTLSLQGDGDTF